MLRAFAEHYGWAWMIVGGLVAMVARTVLVIFWED